MVRKIMDESGVLEKLIFNDGSHRSNSMDNRLVNNTTGISMLSTFRGN